MYFYYYKNTSSHAFVNKKPIANETEQSDKNFNYIYEDKHLLA